jgi:hypothetical protein
MFRQADLRGCYLVKTRNSIAANCARPKPNKSHRWFERDIFMATPLDY